jgi:hypothetical protein
MEEERKEVHEIFSSYTLSPQETALFTTVYSGKCLILVYNCGFLNIKIAFPRIISSKIILTEK